MIIKKIYNSITYKLIVYTFLLKAHDILSLKTLYGAIAIPRDWTDKATPNPYQACPFSKNA